MNFKEYYLFMEDIELFNLLDEGLINAAVSGLGNLGGQIVRGTGNAIGGTYNAAMGGAQVTKGLVQGLGGGFKKAGENISSGSARLAKGFGQAGTGVLQAGLSPISGTMRAAQASDEDMGTKMSSDRSWFQKSFGLNNWNAKEIQQKELETQQRHSDFSNHIQTARSSEDPTERFGALQSAKKLDPERYEQLRQIGKQKRLKAG